MKSFRVEKPQKLFDFLSEKYGVELSYSTYKKLLRNKDVKINKTRIKSETMVNIGDLVEVYYDGNATRIDIVYKDENVLICDKPSGIESKDFEKLVQAIYPSAKLSHRLDRNTSGLIVLSLNEIAEKELYLAFKLRTVDKYYLAEVYGFFDKTNGILEDYLLKNKDKSLVKIYSNKVDGGEKIITEYETITKKEKTSILKVKLITGKTHQIRAHLAYYGHFIIGDGKYGDNAVNKNFKVKYQRLIAKTIKFNFSGGILSYLNGKIFISKIDF
ncbi:MAG: RluA family pseudouridine synthase [Clostridia bacterium]|nr:RluA family pseudouridine synthase [Clostridia bacterium]